MKNKFLEFSRAYQNPKVNPNQSFCALAWYHLATTAFGEIRLCCRSHLPLIENGEALSLKKLSLAEIWKGPRYLQVRKSMESGEILPECEVCTAEESAQRVLSKRLKENFKYFKRFDRVEVSAQPRYLSLNFGNLCNLRCRMCFPNLSTQIFTEMTELLKSPADSACIPAENRMTYDQAVAGGSSNWVEETGFLDQIDYSQLVEVYVTGGEPVLQPEFFDFLERCLAAGRSDIFLRIQSNLTTVSSRFMELANQFSRMQIICSVDGVGDLAHYVRFPSQFVKINENFDELCRRLRPDIDLVVQTSVNSYSILQMPEIIRWFSDKSRMHPGRTISFWINPVHHPYCLCVTNLPEKIKAIAIERLDSIYNEVDAVLIKHQVTDLKEFIRGRECDPKLFEEFLRYTKLLDRSRGQDVRQFVPELAPYF